MRKAFQDSTHKNIRSHKNMYERVCAKYKLITFPADAWQLCRYAQYLFNMGRVPGTIANHLSSICTMQAIKGYNIPALKDICIRLHFKGLKRVSGHVKKQAKAMTPQVLIKIAELVNYKDTKQLVCFVALLMGFFLLLCKSNLVPNAMNEKNRFNPKMQLQCKGLRIGHRIILVKLKCTKTIQYGQRSLELPLLPLVSKKICPIHWITKMVKLIPPQASSLVLVVPIKNGLKPLTYFQLSAQLKKWVKMINLDPKYYTFHCLRQGGVTWAFDADISNETIRLMGDWASDAYKVTACYQKIQCRN